MVISKTLMIIYTWYQANESIKHPSKYFCLRCYSFSKINKIIFKINFCHPKTEIPLWNDYEQSECIFTMLSLTTQWNKLKLSQVRMYTYLWIVINYVCINIYFPQNTNFKIK